MKLEISLAPSGNLILHLPSGRLLEIGLNVGGLGHLKKVLSDASFYRETGSTKRGYIGAFPSQSIVDKWLKEDAERKLEQAKEEREALESELNLSLDTLDISL